MLTVTTLERLARHSDEYPGVSEVTLPVDTMTELAKLALRVRSLDIDERALELAEQIMETMKIHYLGGDQQRKAVIQCLISDELKRTMENR